MKKRIAIFQKDLKLGGIQKSLINLLNNIEIDKYEIDLYLFSNDNFYNADFPENINVIYRKRQSYIARFIPFGVYFLLKHIDISQRYDIAIDFNGYQNITATHALKVQANQRVYWVHNDFYIRRSTQQKNILKSLYTLLLLTRNKWRRFDKFVGVSEGVLDGFRADFPEKDFVAIPNMIDVEEIIRKSHEQVDDLRVEEDEVSLAVLGRLEHQKGVDLLVPKLAEVVKARQDIHLYIIGDGSLRRALEDLTRELSLDQYITFLGAKKNPFKYLAKMDGLVLYSRYEGQGMVLMEAKALGLPLYFPKHLEKYNEGLVGTDDIIASLIGAKRITNRQFDMLEDYNKNIIKKIEALLLDK